jgi:thiosulfate dehydrogenase
MLPGFIPVQEVVVGKFILGLIIGLLLIPAGAFLYVKSGRVPVATSAPPLPFEKKLAKMGLSAKIDKEAPKKDAFAPDEESYMVAAHFYRENCAVCHGLPGQPQTAIAKGMYPAPPQLLKGKGVTDDPAGETYWKVANGIRLTGMPSFGKSASETEMWQVSLLLANADKLPASAKQILSEPMTPSQGVPAAAAQHPTVGAKH